MKKLLGAGGLAGGTILFSRFAHTPRIYQTWVGLGLSTASALQAAVTSLTTSRGKRSSYWVEAYPGYGSAESMNRVGAVRFAFANVLMTNPHPMQLVEEIASRQPDIVVLCESDGDEWNEMLVASFPEHGYRHFVRGGEPGSSFSVVSRAPIADFTVHENSEEADCRGFLEWKTQLPSGEWIPTFAIHPPAPISVGFAEEWSRYLARATDAIPTSGPVVVLGDFNATGLHGPFRHFRRRVNGEVVTRYVPTWPQNAGPQPPLGGVFGWAASRMRWVLPLDHVIVRGLRVWRVEIGSGAGSDHRPVYVDLGQ